MHASFARSARAAIPLDAIRASDLKARLLVVLARDHHVHAARDRLATSGRRDDDLEAEAGRRAQPADGSRRGGHRDGPGDESQRGSALHHGAFYGYH